MMFLTCFSLFLAYFIDFNIEMCNLIILWCDSHTNVICETHMLNSLETHLKMPFLLLITLATVLSVSCCSSSSWFVHQVVLHGFPANIATTSACLQISVQTTS